MWMESRCESGSPLGTMLVLDRLKRYFDAGVVPLVDDVEKMIPGAEALGIKRWKPVYRKDNDKQND